MQRWRFALAVLVILGGAALGIPGSALAAEDDPPLFAMIDRPAGQGAILSPYWSENIQRWDSLIDVEAKRWSTDPDLIASVIWKESRGNEKAISYKGAVGLMQVMSYESGFKWRPHEDVLLDPASNLYHGTRILTTVICQGKGDLFNALAAYNGGWDLAQARRPRAYATDVMRQYAAAVAMRRGVPEESHWQVLVGVWSAGLRGPIWVVDSERTDVYLFGNDNRIPDGSGVLIPEGVPPSAEVAQCTDEKTGEMYWTVMWVHQIDGDQWLSP